MTPDVATIARGLSLREQEVIKNGRCGLPRLDQEWSADCICAAGAAQTSRLCSLGLAARRTRFPGGYILSDLGLALRAHLLENKP